MNVQHSVTREHLFERMDLARRAADYVPDGAFRQQEIGGQWDRFERLPGQTVAEMSQQALTNAEVCRSTGQAWWLVSLLAGGGLMVAGHVAGSQGLMLGGLGVLVGGGMLVAGRFDAAGRRHLGDFASLQSWEKACRVAPGTDTQTDEMLERLRQHLQSGDFRGALSQGHAILEQEDEIIVGDHAVSLR